ncbi:MAG TPA: AsmA-like C-terminal region-containing protein [Candidatus Acidoferrum sp.]
MLASGGLLFWRAQHVANLLRPWAIRSLSEHFQSRVELSNLSVSGFPLLSVTAEDLSIHFDDRTDAPPLIHIDSLKFNLGLRDLLHLPRSLTAAQIDNMTITIPPREDNRNATPQHFANAHNAIASVLVNEVICKNTILVMLPRKPDPGKPAKEPFEWDIHDLKLTSASLNKPSHFHGTLTNAKPKGEIETSGSFGPWDIDDPGSTPVDGIYRFTDADLGPFPGIAGILSSTGKFSGEISKLEVEGETDTPDFSLDGIGKPVPLHTAFSATVDGTNGDTLLHTVRATLIRSTIVANGSVIRAPENKGHTIIVSFDSADARIQDILALAVKSDKPFLTGTVRIRGKLLVPPSPEKALDRMILDGQFGLDDAEWANQEVRDKLQGLSRRAEGKPGDQDAGSATSDLRGKFHVEKGVARFSSLTFSIPGADVDLAGTYNLVGGELDFNGHLRLQAKLSQTVTGAKSFFLKAVDPFLKKDGGGVVIPISITGTRENATIGVTILHKTIEKKIGASNTSFR